MKVGDLVVHIGAKPNGYRARLVIDFDQTNHKDIDGRIYLRDIIYFVNGRYDWKDQWRVFNGWK
tara:strand:+ start:232 stop:423 length:192 start_codon:yes stop_codon:yes gene_type:complete